MTNGGEPLPTQSGQTNTSVANKIMAYAVKN